jgi:hypothetical protein
MRLADEERLEALEARLAALEGRKPQGLLGSLRSSNVWPLILIVVDAIVQALAPAKPKDPTVQP